MKELLKNIQIFRSVPLSGKQFVYSAHEICMVQHLSSGILLSIFYGSYRIFVNMKKIDMYDTDTKRALIIPYNCEDRNEFFQLSTIHDYQGITYDDLMEFHDFCDFMIKRVINERSRV